MSRRRRLALVALTVAVAAATFVVVRPDGDDDEKAATVPARTASRPMPEPKPATTRIEVRGGQPVGGVKRIEAEKGDTVRLRVSSDDTSSEVHVHGYDLRLDMAPGRPISFRFEATIEGVFEVELEGRHVRIATLVVKPS